MSTDTKIILNLIAAAVILFFSGLFISMALDRARCNAEAVSFEHRWGPMQGCMIKSEDGKWIPLKNYRALERP